jgi:hypothetical protein
MQNKEDLNGDKVGILNFDLIDGIEIAIEMEETEGE